MKQSHGRRLVADALRRDARRIRHVGTGRALGRRGRSGRQPVHGGAAVLHDEMAAGVHPAHQPAVGRAQVGPHLVGADPGDNRGEAREVGEQQVVVAEQRDRHAQLPDRVGERVARAHHVAHRDARRRAHVECDEARLRRTQDLAPLDVVVLDRLDEVAMLAAVADRHRAQRERPRAQARGRRHPEAGHRLLSFGRERQRGRRRLHREARRRLEAHLGGSRALREAAHRGPQLQHLPRTRERNRRDVGREPHRQLRHDRELVPSLAADEGAFVAPHHRHADARRHAGHPQPGAGGHGRWAPGERLVGRDDELVPVPIRQPPPVGLRGTRVAGGRDAEAGALGRAARERPGLTLAPLDRPAARRLELERVHLERRGGVVEESDGDAERLPRRHQAVVRARLQHQPVGERQGRLHVALFVPQAPVDLRARARVGQERGELGPQHARRPERRGQGGHAGLRRHGCGRDASGREPAVERGERRRQRVVAGCEAPQADDRCVDPVQDVGLGCRDGRLGIHQPEAPLGGAGIDAELSRALAAVHRPRAHTELLPGHAQQRVVDPRRHAQRAGLGDPERAADPALVELARLPHRQGRLGEARRIGRGPERVAHELGDRVVVLAAAGPGERQRHDHVRPELAHDVHDVAQRLLAAPLRERLLHAEGVAELEGATEVLLDRVVAVERQELAHPQHAERVEQLRPDRVLAALAAGDGEQRRAQPETARQPNQDPVVLVVGVRRHVEHARGRSHAPQREGEARGAAV